jgi:3-deoxy-7-phosphoheptulonate synthase
MLSNTNINKIDQIISPLVIKEKYSADNIIKQNIIKWRSEISDIIQKKSDKLLVIVGPCSIHDFQAALDYAKQLKQLQNKYQDNLFIIMRVYFEKPRTTVGWKGLINDPYLDNSYQINDGLDIARKLLLEINRLEIPVGCEFLDVITPQYIADLVSWGAIGARTTESQIHRQLASGLSMPIGFKNGTGGSIDIAVDAVISAKSSHVFLGVTESGSAAIVNTKGNKDSHIILRGGKCGPNYESEYIDNTASLLRNKKLIESIIVDCSHANSRKIFTNQIKVAENISQQLQNKETRIVGTMIESNIKEGNQKLINPNNLEYGLSITDACVNLGTTEKILEILNSGVIIRSNNSSLYRLENSDSNKKLKFNDFQGGINYLI